jgi:hypothetical protein
LAFGQKGPFQITIRGAGGWCPKLKAWSIWGRAGDQGFGFDTIGGHAVGGFMLAPEEHLPTVTPSAAGDLALHIFIAGEILRGLRLLRMTVLEGPAASEAPPVPNSR